MDTCASCGAVNRGEAAFCASCGTHLGRACPSCGTVAARPARYCDHCGAALDVPAAAPGPQQSRKVVTILFADLSGSTSAQEQMDPEAVRRWMDRYYAAMRAEIEGRGGRLVKVIGDGVMAAFGVPDVREDDARRAIEAAVAMQRAVDELDGESRVRIGINTGEVVVTANDDDVVGDTVNVAARLEQAAGAGEILVGEATFRLVRLTAQLRALPPLELKGKAERVQAFRLVTLVPVEDTGASTPFIGRQVELGRLLTVLDDAIKSNRARLVTIVGSPGVGKTRLARELAAAADDRARVVEMRCDPAGGATFAPVAEALRIAASIDDDANEGAIVAHLTAVLDEDEPNRDRIGVVAGALLGAGEPGQPEETFWAVRRLVENAGRRRPIVLFFDDVHWAEPLLLDLIDNLVEWIRDAAVLVVMTARPELREQRPSLVEEGGRLSAAIHLEGLGSDESRRLACELLDAESLPDVLLERLVAASDGNPLFVGELLRMLVDDGVLQREGDAWTATVDLAELDVPLTIHALLSARIDRLGAAEREVLETASVMGKTFYRGAVAAMVGAAVRDDLDATLERLRRKELVEPAGTYWIDEPVHRFHHVLIRDAAYRRLLKDARAALHDGVATWLEEKVGDAIEHDDLIGYQLEQAFLLRDELDQHDAAVGSRAAERLAAAGRRALESDDCVSAAALLGRAIDCLEPDDPRVAGLLVDRCEALLTAGNVTEAVPAIERLDEVAATPDQLTGWTKCFSAEIANLTSTGSLATAIEQTADAAARFAALGDAAGEAKAHAVRAASLARLGRIGECEAALDLALGAARRAGDRRRATAVLAGAPAAALWGPNPVTRASGRCLDVVRVLRITSRSPAVEATSLRCQAVLESLRGRTDAARRMLASARQSLEDLGNAPGLLDLDVATGMVEQLAGELPIAEDHLRRARDGFLDLGIDADAAFSGALLADVLVSRGRVDEALALTEESERRAGEDLRTAIAWRSVRAIALVGRGDIEEGRRLATEAVELAETTDALIDHAKALVALAAALRASGDEQGSRARARRALELYERKEATVLASQVHAFLGEDATSARFVGDEQAHPRSPSRGNAASRALLQSREASMAAEWDVVARLLAPDVLLRDHRPMLRVETTGAEGFIEHVQAIVALGVESIEQTMAMVRGDRLLLERSIWRGATRDVEVEVLSLNELDPQGRVAIVDLYEDEQVCEATIELDRRFMAGEGAEHTHVIAPVTQWLAGILRRDWDLLRAALHDDFVGVDHRPLGWGTVGPDDFTELYRTAVRLAPNTWGGFFELHELTDGGVCGHAELDGTTVEGAEFRTTATAVAFADDGKISRVEFFPIDQPERGLALLRGEAQADLANSASRAYSELITAGIGGDWGPAKTRLAEDVVMGDHRALFGGFEFVGRDLWIETTRSVVQPGSAAEPRTLAVRGDRLALLLVRYTGPDILFPVLHLATADEHGQLTRVENFDLDQLDDAVGVLDERFLAHEGGGSTIWRCMSEAFRAMNERDFDRYRLTLGDEFEIVDHRPLSFGTIQVDAYVEASQALINQSHDVRWMIAADHGVTVTSPAAWPT